MVGVYETPYIFPAFEFHLNVDDFHLMLSCPFNLLCNDRRWQFNLTDVTCKQETPTLWAPGFTLKYLCIRGFATVPVGK